MNAPKDGHTRQENLQTQPLVRHRVFDNPDVITEAWYPVCPSSELRRGAARSFLITWQRIAVFRGEDGVARALDAFCPHMGADLGNGRVRGVELECYFHQWRFRGDGTLAGIRCAEDPPKGVCTAAYPVEEKYGLIWVWAGPEAAYPVPDLPGLEGEEVAFAHLGEVTLYAHHHVMMAGGIDLQHFAAVHDLDVDFELEVDEKAPGVCDFALRGELKSTGWRSALGRRLLGPKIGYDARFAGGSIVALTYGPSQRFGGTGFRLPPLHILWGCAAEQSGVSRVRIVLATKRREGLLGALASRALLLLTLLLLVVLRDDDVKAFPHMRFNTGRLIAADRSVARFVRWVDRLPLSRWSRPQPEATRLPIVRPDALRDVRLTASDDVPS